MSWSPPHTRDAAPIQVSTLASTGPSIWARIAAGIALVALAAAALWFFVLQDTSAGDEEAAAPTYEASVSP